jgi:hypothetical protein
MSRKVWIALVVAVCLLSGVGRLVAEEKSGKERFFEMRTYTAAEGKMDALLARFRNHTNRIFEKHGIQIVGYWVPTDEQKKRNTLIYILAYPSADAREKSWKAFSADPEWKNVVAESQKNGKLVAKVESVYMTPTDFSPIK